MLPCRAEPSHCYSPERVSATPAVSVSQKRMCLMRGCPLNVKSNANIFLKIEVELIHNVTLVSSVQHGDLTSLYLILCSPPYNLTTVPMTIVPPCTFHTCDLLTPALGACTSHSPSRILPISLTHSGLATICFFSAFIGPILLLFFYSFVY